MSSVVSTVIAKYNSMGRWRIPVALGVIATLPVWGLLGLIVSPILLLLSPVAFLAFIWWLMRQVAIFHNPKSLVGPGPPVPPSKALASCTGLVLHTYRWKPKKDPIGYAFIAHGYGEHGARYNHVAAALTAVGLEVHAIDHQGHGKSEGDRAYVGDYRELTKDMLRLIDSVVQSPNHKPLPVFLIGHSMGGGVAIHVANERPSLFAGVVLSAPAIVPDPNLATPFIRKISGFLSTYLPKMPLPAKKIGADKVTRDPKEVEKYLTDPLVYHGDIRSRTGATLLESMDNIIAGAKEVQWPFLMVHGTGDVLTLMEGSEFFHANASSADKTLIKYDGLYHEVFNEPEKEQVLSDVVSWIQERL